MLFLFELLFFPYISNKPRSQRESCLFSTSVCLLELYEKKNIQIERAFSIILRASPATRRSFHFPTVTIMEETLTSGEYVPNFNFKYVYMKFEKLRDNWHVFEEITQKLASRENYASEEIKFTIFYCSSSDKLNCHSLQATIN